MNQAHFTERVACEGPGQPYFVREEHIARYEFASQRARGKLVLDIACGTGYGSQMLAAAGAKRVLGVDISEKAIEHAERNFDSPRLEFAVADANDLRLKESGFDLIVSFETVQHLASPEAFLAGLRELLKTDGRLARRFRSGRYMVAVCKHKRE